MFASISFQNEMIISLLTMFKNVIEQIHKIFIEFLTTMAFKRVELDCNLQTDISTLFISSWGIT